MGSLDDNNVYVYDENDPISPLPTFMNLGQASVSAAIGEIRDHSLIMPVANAAERDAYEAQMRSEGRAPTPASPLYVDRADTGAVEKHNGSGWKRFVDNTLEQYQLVNTDPLWFFNNIALKKNGWVTVRIRSSRRDAAWNGSRARFWTSMPARFRPPGHHIQFPVFVHVRNDWFRSALFTIEPDGTGYLEGTLVGAGNWIYGTATWPTAGD